MQISPSIADKAKTCGMFTTTGCARKHGKGFRWFIPPTDDVMADELTKVLPYEAHQRFIRQIGLVDIEERLKERRLQEITLDEL
jgi:hypothetical protein